MKREQQWLVRLKGDRLDLANLSKFFRSPNMMVTEENAIFYLRSARFESLTDPSDVASLTARFLPILNSVARPSSPVIPRVRAESLIAIDPNGNHVVVTLPSPIFAWGSNDSGQLAIPTVSIEDVPTRVMSLAPGVGFLSAGFLHGLAIKPRGFTTAGQTTSGTVLAWGNNPHGELGIGTTSVLPVLTPVQVIDPANPSGLLSGVKGIAAGGNHSLALKTDGTVWAWGFNSNGQLGDGTREDRLSPVVVGGLEEIELIAAGSFHSLAVRSDGAVFAWGFNFWGQLGIGQFSLDSPVPTRVLGPLGGGFLSGIVNLGAGLLHSLAVRGSDGAVFAWGSNTNGQLGVGTVEAFPFPVQISGLAGIFDVDGGRLHSLAMSLDGACFAWGDNSFGQIGNGTVGAPQLSPVQISASNGEHLISVAAGDNHSLVSTTSGALLAWGNNASGQLGDGTRTNRSAPVAVLGDVAYITAGSNYSLAFTEPFL
jgi:alpha-tubulin suppressor-like RCC1 family protein